MKSFKQFINEGVMDLLQPKSDDNIKNILSKKSAVDVFRMIRKFDIPDKFLPSDEELYNMINKKERLTELFSELLNHKIKYVKMFIDIFILPIKDKIRKQQYLDYSLKVSFEQGNADIFEYLLNLGADINSTKNTDTILKFNQLPSDKKLKMKEIYNKYKNNLNS